MKKTVAFVLLFCMTIVLLTSCSGSTTETPKSAVEQLNADEKEVYDIIVLNIDDFKNPASVKVIGEIEKTDCLYYVKISATNSYGSATSTNYYLFTDTWKNSEGERIIGEYGSMRTLNSVSSSLQSMSISLALEFASDLKGSQVLDASSTSKINAALEEYKTQMGYN